MGAGGIRGELRDHSEHVDTILRSHFNVANTPTTSFSTSSRSGPHQQNSILNFNFTDGALEEMACYSCGSNFSVFRRKVLLFNLPAINYYIPNFLAAGASYINLPNCVSVSFNNDIFRVPRNVKLFNYD